MGQSEMPPAAGGNAPFTGDATFGAAPRLPRGPNNLTAEEIAESQRVRLMNAMAELLAERGWAGITIGELVSRASVSRTAFYDHFDDKLGCLLASYDFYSARLISDAAAALSQKGTSDDIIMSALKAYFGSIQQCPTSARAYFVEMDSAGPVARRRRRDGAHVFAAMIAEQHRRILKASGSTSSPPFLAYFGIALALRELVRDELENDPDADLNDLVDDVHIWMMTMVRGSLDQ